VPERQFLKKSKAWEAWEQRGSPPGCRGSAFYAAGTTTRKTARIAQKGETWPDFRGAGSAAQNTTSAFFPERTGAERASCGKREKREKRTEPSLWRDGRQRDRTRQINKRTRQGSRHHSKGIVRKYQRSASSGNGPIKYYYRRASTSPVIQVQGGRELGPISRAKPCEAIRRKRRELQGINTARLSCQGGAKRRRDWEVRPGVFSAMKGIETEDCRGKVGCRAVLRSRLGTSGEEWRMSREGFSPGGPKGPVQTGQDDVRKEKTWSEEEPHASTAGGKGFDAFPRAGLLPSKGEKGKGVMGQAQDASEITKKGVGGFCRPFSRKEGKWVRTAAGRGGKNGSVGRTGATEKTTGSGPTCLTSTNTCPRPGGGLFEKEKELTRVWGRGAGQVKALLPRTGKGFSAQEGEKIGGPDICRPFEGGKSATKQKYFIKKNKGGESVGAASD